MSRADSDGSESAGRDPYAPYASMDDGELLAAMRRDEARAFTEFVRRHHRLLLRYARVARLDREDADALTMEVIEDTVLRLVGVSAVEPRDVRAYMVRAFHHRYLNLRRAAKAREGAMRSAARSGHAELDGQVVAAACSESALRDARPRHLDEERAPTARGAVLRLGLALDAALSDDERRLLTWVGEHVPQRLIAEWLGVSFAAARQKLSRLRRRLRALADRHVAALDAEERCELEGVLRRTGVPPWEGAAGARRTRGRGRSAEKSERSGSQQEEQGDE